MPKVHIIEMAQDFPVSVERLFAHLAEHENLARLFAPASVRRLRDGATTRNGVGSLRRVTPLPLAGFDETVTVFRQDELIEYRITRGGPLRNHRGRMSFVAWDGNVSRVAIVITFEAKVPGTGGLLAWGLRHVIAGGLLSLTREPALGGDSESSCGPIDTPPPTHWQGG